MNQKNFQVRLFRKKEKNSHNSLTQIMIYTLYIPIPTHLVLDQLLISSSQKTNKYHKNKTK